MVVLHIELHASAFEPLVEELDAMMSLVPVVVGKALGPVVPCLEVGVFGHS